MDPDTLTASLLAILDQADDPDHADLAAEWLASQLEADGG